MVPVEERLLRLTVRWSLKRRERGVDTSEPVFEFGRDVLRDRSTELL